MNDINSTSVPVICRNISYRSIGEETILLNLDNNIYYSLNITGRFIWEHIDSNQDIRQISVLTSKEFDVSQSQAEEDIIELLGELVQEGFVSLG